MVNRLDDADHILLEFVRALARGAAKRDHDEEIRLRMESKHQRSTPPPSANLRDDDEPLTLEEACRLLFRNAIRPATLRTEAAKGRLVIERIGRRDFVTRAAIREMRRQCEVVTPKADHPKTSLDDVETAYLSAKRIVAQLRSR